MIANSLLNGSNSLGVLFSRVVNPHGVRLQVVHALGQLLRPIGKKLGKERYEYAVPSDVLGLQSIIFPHVIPNRAVLEASTMTEAGRESISPRGGAL